jgi:PAS domain S-box-containing protein
MKRILLFLIPTLLILFVLPLSTGFASPLERPDSNTYLNFAPGSIVRFEHLSIEDGLSQNAGLDIFQDSRGFLWIGTQDGLNRYDGYSFKVYKHDPEMPTSISHNSILKIAEDENGILWIGTWGGGLNRYDPATETFTSYQHNPDDPSSISNDTVTALKEDSKGNLWVGTLSGLDRFDPATSTFEHFKNDPDDPDSLSNNAISVIFEDSQQQLWIGTGAYGTEGSGLNRFDPSTGKAVRFQQDKGDPDSLSSNNIAAIYENDDGTFWIATGGFSLPGGGLIQFNPNTGKALAYKNNPSDPESIGGNDLMSLWGDSTGTLWIGTWANGLSRMEFSNPGKFTRYQYDPYFKDSLSGDEVWALFKDRLGILWVGTSHSGINKLSASAGQFSLYQNNPSDPASLGINATGAFAEDPQGNIWVATWGAGLDRFNPTTGQFSHYRHDAEDLSSLSDDLFMAVYVDESNTVWAGTLGKGLNQLDPITGKVAHYLHDPGNPASLADDNIASIISDQKGGLWIGTFGGISHYDPATGRFTNYASDPNDPNSLSQNMVVSLFIDSRNNLWAGTWGGGLNQLDLNDPAHVNPNLARFTQYHADPEDPSSLSEDSVWAIHETADGNLWLGTQQGLNKLDPVTKKFTHYTEKQGLPNNVVLGILEDDSGDLWLTTNNGLAQFNPQTTEVTVYDSSNGLQSNEFNSNAYYRASDGTMYIGGINGFNLFRPENIHPNPVAPQVAITQFKVYNETLPVDLSGKQPIELDYDQDFISFEFAAFDFQAPQKNQYAYKLEGFDKDWIQAGNRRYATYTNLPGGEYIFRLKASNSDGIWNDTGIAIPIRITPPFWQTWWFNGILILGVAALVAGGFRWRTTSIREQNIHLETEVAERTVELSEANKLLEKEVEQRKRAEAELEKQAAEELQQAEKRFQAMFDHSAIGIALVGVDGKPQMVNPEILRMTGYSKQELLRMSGLDMSYPADRELATEPMRELLSGRRKTFQGENRFVRKDSQVYWVRQTISTVSGSDGNPLYLVVMVEDIDKSKKAALALQDSEERFQAMFNSAAIGIGMMDLNRRVIQGNLQARGLLGYSSEELKDLDVIEHTHPDDRAIDRELFSELTSGKRDSYQVEKRYRHKDGHWVWARSTLSAVKDSGGHPIYILALVEDISQHIQTLAELRESEARFRSMFDTAAVGITLLAPDRHVLAVNPVVVKMSGYSEAEHLGLLGTEITYPDDRDIGREEFLEIQAGKRDAFTMEKRFVRKDGVVYWTRLSVSAVRDPEGRLLYMVAITEDIDQQKHALEDLQESEARFRSMFEHSAIGIGVMGLDRRIIDANPAICHMYGWTREEMIGMNAGQVTYPEDEPASRQLFQELIDGGRDSYDTQRRYIRKNGETFWAHVTISSVRGTDGKPLYLVGMVLDITEQKHAAEELRKSQAQFQAIFDNVAVGVAVMTLGRRPLAFNAASERIIGYNIDEIRDIDPRTLAIPEDREIDILLFQELMEGRRNSYVMERRYRRKDGRIFWARINYSLVRDMEGRPDYLIGIIEDIDDQKRSAERLATQEADYLLMLQQRVQERTHELEEANQRLQLEMEQRTKIEKELSEKAAEEAVAADRTRLARDLHDAVTQTLFSASLIAEVLPDLWDMDADEAKRSTEELRQLTRGALAEMRTLLLELRPATLTQTRLSDLIKQLCEAFIGRSRLPIKLSIEGDCQLPPEVQIAVYRIAQESLNNVFKYARATQVDVNLFISENTVGFVSCDNGIGFDMAIVKPTSLGMRIMRERAEAIGANFQVTSQPGAGTCVEVTWNRNPNAKLKVM